MKLSLRRSDDASPQAGERPSDDTPAPPRPPRGRPVVAYAAVLDGRHLWLAVHATPGSLALRDPAGDVVAARSDVADDDPAYRSVRVDLEELAERGDDAPAAYDVVLVPAGGGAAKPVWTHPLPAGSLVRPPVAADGSHAWSLARLDDGTLQVRRAVLAPTATLHEIGTDGDAVTVVVQVPPGHGGTALLRLLDADGVLALSRPLAPGPGPEGRLTVSLTTADLPPDDEVRLLRLHVDDLPVRRRHNDLVDPERATLLPVLFGADDAPAATFRYTRDGSLAVRVAALPASSESGAS